MIGIGNIFLTVYFWSAAIISSIVTYVICLCCYPFISQKYFAYLYETLFSTMILYPMIIPRFWSIKITDTRQQINRHFNGPYIVISNHASFIDTLIASQIPLVKKFIMAKKFTTIPIFGWLCKCSGHIAVSDKSDKSGRRDPTLQSAVDLSVKAMDDGSSFMIYPEGSRSKNPNQLLPFKTGAFRLAQNTGVPILPIVIKGTGTAMPIGGFCHLATIEIVIGDPFSVSKKYKDIKKDPQIEKVRNFIQSQLDR